MNIDKCLMTNDGIARAAQARPRRQALVRQVRRVSLNPFFIMKRQGRYIKKNRGQIWSIPPIIIKTVCIFIQ